MTALETIIKDKILQGKAMRFDHFMGLCLGHPEHGYYMKKDPLGGAGDFITAPEISQLFGESLAIWLVQSLTETDGRPLHIIEFGAGRGTLMADIVRSCQKIAPSILSNAKISLIEISPVLKEKQRAALSDFDLNIAWFNDFDSAYEENSHDGAYLTRIIGNEFFDALPVRQFKKDDHGAWSELYIDYKEIAYSDGAFVKSWQATDFHVPAPYQDNNIYEYNEIAEKIVTTITEKPSIKSCFIDYGYADKTGLKDTIQTLYQQQQTTLFDHIGDQDITAHVNFGRLITIIESTAIDSTDKKTSLIPQAEFLTRNGFMIRANQLLKHNPTQHDKIEKAVHRLTHRDEMGTLFKVLEF